MLKFLIMLLLIPAILGCSNIQTKTALQAKQATHATKVEQVADISSGIVTLNYQYSIFEMPLVNWNKLKFSAINQCIQAGYQHATMANNKPARCINRQTGNICNRWQLEVTYNCSYHI